MRVRILLLLLAIVMLSFPAEPSAATSAYPIREGAHVPAVKSVQWLLGGHRPSAYKDSIRTFPYRPNGLYGKRTAKAVRDAKWRLGYPQAFLDGRVVDRAFVDILLGKKARPVGWVARAAWRLKRSPSHNAVIPGSTALARRILQVAQAQLGRPCGRTYECWGENDGPLVRMYQATTGAFRAPWCVSFVQWILYQGGYGYTANRSAGVFYVVNYWRSRGALRSQAQAGRLVAFMDRLGHIGIVERVFAGGFYSIEGNASDSVVRRKHFIGSRPLAFVALPGVS